MNLPRARQPHPPPFHGIAASRHCLPASSPHALLADYLAARFPHVAALQWQQRLQAGLVLDASLHPLRADARFEPHALIWYYRQVPDEPPIPLQATVLYQDAHLVVADKPHFLPVTPGGRHARETLLTRLQQQLGLPDLAPMHRLDRETAGLVLFSVQPATRPAYAALFRQRLVDKRYLAIAPWHEGVPPCGQRASRLLRDPRHFFRMMETDGPANSLTRMTVSRVLPGSRQALYLLEPVTGRQHQLRVHMAAMGLPIEGDQFYPTILRGPHEPEDYLHPLQLLAQSLAFRDPLTGQMHAFHSSRRLHTGD